METLVAALARFLVQKPDAVEVVAVPEGATTVLELSVAPEDMGRIIGRQGRTVRALRQVLAAAARNEPRHYELEIMEEETG